MGKIANTSYLGDGVYAFFDGSGVELRANDHEDPSDTIYMEPETIEALNVFFQCRLQSKAQEEAQDDQPQP
jgi:hypothetical protein